MRRALTVLLILGFPTSSWADPYADHYGDGLRLYAEGRYDVALESLYRAYALKPSANLLKLIVRSHDFMGHCSAVERQLVMFRDTYPREDAPAAQLCANPGTLKIECSTHAGSVVIDHMITTSCGTAVKLPAGVHRVHSKALNEAREFVVTPGEVTTATLQLNPEKWFPSRGDQSDQGQFTVLKSADGLYEIWLKSSLRDDPEMANIRIPGFTIVRSKDGLFDISSDELKEPYTAPSKPRERRKMPVVPIAP